ncbi:hypothetical protein PG997_009181, partial [Apiospora hydei]
MDSRSPSRERYGRSPTPPSRYSRSPSPMRRRRSPTRSASPAPRRNGRYRDERSKTRSRSRSRSISRSRSRSFSRGRSESPLRGSTKIVVEKLTKNINEDHLREVFGQYGPIRDLDLPMNRQFNTNRGTAYILYIHEADAEAAIAHMHEAQVDGATINVSIVLPRRKFSPRRPRLAVERTSIPECPRPDEEVAAVAEEVEGSEEDLEVALEDGDDAVRLAADLVVAADVEEEIATETTSTPTVPENAPAPFRPRRAEVARLRTVRGRPRPRLKDAVVVVEVAAEVGAIVSTTTGSAVLVTTATAAVLEAEAVATARIAEADFVDDWHEDSMRAI